MKDFFAEGQLHMSVKLKQLAEMRASGHNIQLMFGPCYKNEADYIAYRSALAAAFGVAIELTWEENKLKFAGGLSVLSDADPVRFVEVAKYDYMQVINDPSIHFPLGATPTNHSVIIAPILAQKFPDSVLKPSDVLRLGLS